ncbi:hypothetical protein BDW62DRAFT_218539 [Aspergillus aurantiobrunneus]
MALRRPRLSLPISMRAISYSTKRGDNCHCRLFEYTSASTFTYNEKKRLSERYGGFNIEALRSAAAQSVQRRSTDIKSLPKLAEGGFNRVLQITMVDDTKILARLPYPSTEPKALAVASEVATLALLHARGLPVPRVHAYSTNAKNSVGSEYIIMEKLAGQPLGGRWFDLSDKQRIKVLLQLVQLEAKFCSIKLLASGSIYFSRDLSSDLPRIAISDSGFCIGPSASLRWWFAERATLAINRGPYTDAIDALRSPALKELTWLQAYLEIASELLPSDELLLPLCFLDIAGLIDWQHASVLPLFLAAGIPKFFQNYDDPESLAFLDALDDFRRRHTHFFYLAFTQRFNEPHFRAIDHGGCPMSFSSTEANSVMRLQDMQEDVDLDLERVRNAIGISVDGWTTPDEYEAACARAREIKVKGLVFLDTDYEREMTDRHWPFDDYNEDE